VEPEAQPPRPGQGGSVRRRQQADGSATVGTDRGEEGGKTFAHDSFPLVARTARTLQQMLDGRQADKDAERQFPNRPKPDGLQNLETTFGMNRETHEPRENNAGKPPLPATDWFAELVDTRDCPNGLRFVCFAYFAGTIVEPTLDKRRCGARRSALQGILF
jgi:hypothetical protein